MTSELSSGLTDQQTAVWLRGLLMLAWADGDFDPHEQALIADVTHQSLSEADRTHLLQPITPQEVADTLGHDPVMGENFLRTAVMVAIADGVYSPVEDQVLTEYCRAFELETQILQSLRLTMHPPAENQPGLAPHSTGHLLDPLQPIRTWLDRMEMHDPRVARFLCRMIPPQCPFERDINLFGHKVVHIPPLCKLNPLYEQLVGLRFRALSYLADDCGEDVTPYC